MEKRILDVMKNGSRWIIIFLMIMLMLSMILGAIDLLIDVFTMIFSQDPYLVVMKVNDLYSIFSVIIIIIVGYELFKSMYLILKSDQIPVKSIIKIAAIAIGNKVITLNIKESPHLELFGLAALILSIGAAYFFFNHDTKITE
ncbi:MAG: hypothetical protein FGM54_10525 [Chitinophagaceae bacterium]|nr:hypothetical protein [Chitinophagaceae bacterium]